MKGCPYGGVVLALPEITSLPDCNCGAVAQSTIIAAGYYGVAVHLVGCATLTAKPANVYPLDPPPKPAKILLTTGKPWVPKRPKTYSRSARRGPTNYTLMLQFLFERPINMQLWKRIKAPRGWRKCPTNEDAQRKYYGVRFQCRDLKHSLTPEEIETLRAKLYLALELEF